MYYIKTEPWSGEIMDIPDFIIRVFPTEALNCDLQLALQIQIGALPEVAYVVDHGDHSHLFLKGKQCHHAIVQSGNYETKQH
jgi:hypothetical protein